MSRSQQSQRNTATLFKRSHVQREDFEELNQSMTSKRQKLDDSMSFFRVQEELQEQNKLI